MRSITFTDFEHTYFQEPYFLEGVITNKLKLGRLITTTLNHDNVKKIFPYDFSSEGRLIAVMAIHLYMKKSGKVFIVHNGNNGDKSIHLCIEYIDEKGDIYFIDEEGVGSGSDFLRKMFLWEDCSTIKLEPFNINSLRLSKSPYSEDTDALKAATKLSVIMESMIGEWDGTIF
tara:strand:- start:13932 stop:14450 length:519 start_codon:yes stop_codon:yes gene_type:complete